MQNLELHKIVSLVGVTNVGKTELARQYALLNQDKYELIWFFDSNVDPKFGHVQPFVFTIDAGMVIKGWDVGVAGMKVGEKRNLLITPEFGYGATGAGNIIPPNATLSFDVELVAIKK